MNKPGGKSGFRRLSGAVAVAAVAALTAAGCGGQPAGSVKQGGVFNLGSDTSIDSLNPFVAFQTDAYTTFDYIYPTLAQYNAKMQLVPDFATSWASVRRRQGLDVPHRQGREVVRRQAADRAGRGLDLRHDPEVPERPDRQLGRLRRAHGERDRARRGHPGADLQAAGRQRAVAGAAGADPARARLGQVRHRQGQGPDHVRQQRAGRVRRPVHPVQVHREADPRCSSGTRTSTARSRTSTAWRWSSTPTTTRWSRR